MTERVNKPAEPTAPPSRGDATPAAAQPQPAVAVAPIPYEQYRAMTAVQAVEESRRLEMDKTQPGGFYLGADGEPHDANGEPVKGGKKAADDKG